MNLRWFTKILSCAIPGVGLGIFLLGEWGISARAPGWVRTVGMEIQAAGRDAGTQWMVMVCLVSYFGTFLILERRQSNSTPHPSPLPVRGGEGGENATACRTTSLSPNVALGRKPWQKSAPSRIPVRL